MFSTSASSGGCRALCTSAAVISTVVGLPVAASLPRSDAFWRISVGERMAEPRSTFRSSAVRWPMIRPFSRRM